MKDLSQHFFIKYLSQYKRQFNSHKGFKICDSFLLISKLPFILRILWKFEWLKNSVLISDDFSNLNPEAFMSWKIIYVKVGKMD